MNPFSTYIDCINCGNELVSISELTFRPDADLRCDYCGMRYSRLVKKAQKLRLVVSGVFLVIAFVVMIAAWQLAGFTTALFSLFPLIIIYYFILGYIISRSLR